MRADRNIKLLEAHAVCVNMSFAIAVIVPYYHDVMGLSFQDFLLGEAAFAATVVLLDVPMGWIADIWQRKHVLALGTLAAAAGYALLLCGRGLGLALLAQSIIGIGICLFNGTNSALLYESLASASRESEYRAREGKRGAFALYSVAAASVCGGWLYGIAHALPVLATLVFLCAGIVVACQTDEPERRRARADKHPLKDIAKTMHQAMRHKQIGFVIVAAALLFSATKMVMWSQQPYYMAAGIDTRYYGVLMAAGFALGGFSSHVSHTLRATSLCIVSAAWAMAIAVCLGAAAHVGWGGVALLMVGGTCLFGLSAPQVRDIINRHADPDRRATVLSVQSLAASLVFVPLSAVLGKVESGYGLRMALVCIAVWLCVCGVCLAAVAFKKSRAQLAAS